MSWSGTGSSPRSTRPARRTRAGPAPGAGSGRSAQPPAVHAGPRGGMSAPRSSTGSGTCSAAARSDARWMAASSRRSCRCGEVFIAEPKRDQRLTQTNAMPRSAASWPGSATVTGRLKATVTREADLRRLLRSPVQRRAQVPGPDPNVLRARTRESWSQTSTICFASARSIPTIADVVGPARAAARGWALRLLSRERSDLPWTSTSSFCAGDTSPSSAPGDVLCDQDPQGPQSG